MIDRMLWVLLLLVLVTPASGQVSLNLGQGCDWMDNQDRACLMLESSVKDLTDLRNEITQNMIGAGGGDCGGVSCYVVLICDQCSVDKKVEGCELVNDRVVTTRWQVMSHRIACMLTAVRAKAMERNAQAMILERLDRRADIGHGSPTITDRRSGEIEVEDLE